MSPRARMDLWLTAKIEAIHRFLREIHCSPTIHAEFADNHEIRLGGRKRVARLMRSADYVRKLASLRSDHPGRPTGIAHSAPSGSALLP
jgi:hypothetical protein